MSEQKPTYTYKADGRVQFTLPDLIRALRGFRSPEGYTVMPNDIADRVLEEIERLYEVEDTAVALFAAFPLDGQRRQP
ncbi:MAG: hypothetical protein HC804_04075 [Anaerolineae bacterium]|nr:hypothetical protein [Anaerolineae bacterium]